MKRNEQHLAAPGSQNPSSSSSATLSVTEAHPKEEFFVGQVISCQHGPPDNIFHFRVTELKDGKPSQMELVSVEAHPKEEPGEKDATRNTLTQIAALLNPNRVGLPRPSELEMAYLLTNNLLSEYVTPVSSAHPEAKERTGRPI